MKSNLECDIIKDLLPLYIEELTSEVTNEEIVLHLEECEECKGVEVNMREEMLKNVEVTVDEEVDFLKKIKAKANKKVVYAVLLCVFFIFIGWFIKNNYFGDLSFADDVEIEKIKVEDNKLILQGYNMFNVRERVEEKDGVVTIKFYDSIHALVNDDMFEIEKTFDKDIKKVIIEGVAKKQVVIYEEDMIIDVAISSLYNSRIEEFEVAYANGNKTSTVEGHVENVMINSNLLTVENREWYSPDDSHGISYTLSDVDLQSDEMMSEDDDFYIEDQNTLENYKMAMMEYSTYIMATIGCVDEIILNVKINDEAKEFKYTAKEMSDFVGVDIKEYGKTRKGMQNLKDRLEEKLFEYREEH